MSKAFKECDFGLRVEGEVYPKALTFPIDNLFVDRKLVAFIKLRLSPPGHQKKQDSFAILFALVTSYLKI